MKTPVPRASTTSLSQRLRLLTVAALALTSAASSHATDIAMQKLFGHWNNPPANFSLGNLTECTAATETWIIVGAPEADEGATNCGAVQVFNAATGAWVRELLPPAPITASLAFGTSVAIAGDLALVGAPDSSAATTGAVHVYNLKTGVKVRSLVPNVADGTPGDEFGGALAVSGNRVLIGSRTDDALRGSAYVFDFTTGQQLAKVQDSLGVGGDYFGSTVAAEGNIGVVSSPYSAGTKGTLVVFDLTTYAQLSRIVPTDAVAGSYAGFALAITGGKILANGYGFNPLAGKVFVYDLVSDDQRTLSPSDSAVGDQFGQSIAGSQGLALISGGASGGTAYVFDLSSTSTQEIKRLSRPDRKAGSMGNSMALVGSMAVMASSYDDTQANNAGAVFVYRPITRSMPLTKIAAKGDYAPSAAEINFNMFSDVFQNPQGRVAFSSTLTGAGSNGGKDTGVWDTQAGLGDYLDLAAKSRDTSPLQIASVSSVMMNDSGHTVFQAKLVNAAPGDKAILVDDGTTVSYLRWSNQFETAFPAAGQATAGAMPNVFLRVVQGRNPGHPYMTTACTLRMGIAGTSATTDSGLITRDMVTNANDAEREGAVAGATGLTHGQFTDQLAQFETTMGYTTAVVGAAATNQAVFAKRGPIAPTKAAQKGDTVVDGAGNPVPGVTYSSFNGIAADGSTDILFRATIAGTAGTGVTAANNEGLWIYDSVGFGRRLILRKGVDLGVNAPGFVGVASLAGVKIAKFIAFWRGSSQTFAQVQLTGTGVTAANDIALLLFQTSDVINTPLVLIREGDRAPGCPGATIGVISRVEVEPYWGTYAVLTTLAGAATGTDQALFRGASAKVVTTATQTYRRPQLVLRKGILFDNQPSKVKSISLPTSNLTAAGAGSTGLGTAIQDGNGLAILKKIALIIDFENGVRQVVNGIP